jgi:hypothetical protein
MIHGAKRKECLAIIIVIKKEWFFFKILIYLNQIAYKIYQKMKP